MLEDGIDPNSRHLGMPLLHHTAPSKMTAISQRIIEAGADINATCSFEEFCQGFGSRLEAIAPADLASMGPTVTVLDAARVLGNGELVQLIEAQRAKSAIDAVLKGALNAPSTRSIKETL
jgi:hypothetical protein